MARVALSERRGMQLEGRKFAGQGVSAPWLVALGRWPWPARWGLLLVVLAGELVVFGLVGWQIRGGPGLVAASYAAGLCGLGSSLGLMVGERFRRPDQVWQQFGISTALRMGLPLLAGMVLLKTRSDLAAGGLAYQLIACYLVTLLIDTLLTVAALAAAQTAQRTP